MKSKILCLILIITVLCSIFVISASAQDEYIIEPGTYRWNDVIDLSAIYSGPGDYTVPFSASTNGAVSLDDNDTFIFDPSSVTTINSLYIGYLDVNGSAQLTLSYGGFLNLVYSSSYHWDTALYAWSLPSSASGFGQVFNVTEPISTSADFYSWFANSTSLVPDTVVLTADYYRLKLPIDVTDPSWIGSGNTVWYNMRGRVITDNSNRAFSFYRLGFRYNSWEASVDRGAGWSLDVLINDAQHDDLEILDFSYFADSGQFYWMYNDLVLDSFVGLAIDGDYEVDNDLYVLFTELFEPYEYVYTGNPWYDIVDGVVDALKIDVFGSFSPWDILVTFIGISVFIWLLKLLAGG